MMKLKSRVRMSQLGALRSESRASTPMSSVLTTGLSALMHETCAETHEEVEMMIETAMVKSIVGKRTAELSKMTLEWGED